MIAAFPPLLAALVLVGQVAPRPTLTAPTPILILAVNAEVTIHPSAVAVDLTSLNALADILVQANSPPEIQANRYLALVKSGKVIELDGPTRLIIQKVITDNKFVDPATSRSVPIVSGPILDGPRPNLIAFAFATQLNPTPSGSN